MGSDDTCPSLCKAYLTPVLEQGFFVLLDRSGMSLSINDLERKMLP